MIYLAAFFDRDGTLSYHDPEITKERDLAISEIVGYKVRLDNALKTRAFSNVCRIYKELKSVKDLDTEDRFWMKWFEQILQQLGVHNNLEEHAKSLFRQYALYKTKKLYPEVIPTLEYFSQAGHKLGVISDTFPSLELTLNLLGIRHYFQNVTASSLVGAGKPDPRIFNSALNDLNVQAEESIFVDDVKNKADGAREMGFTSFHLKRKGKCQEDWAIKNLTEMVEYHKAAIE